MTKHDKGLCAFRRCTNPHQPDSIFCGEHEAKRLFKAVKQELNKACEEQAFVSLTFTSDDGDNVKIPCNLIKSVRKRLFDFKPDILTLATGKIDRVLAVEPI